jgi:hypothetical protein
MAVSIEKGQVWRSRLNPEIQAQIVGIRPGRSGVSRQPTVLYTKRGKEYAVPVDRFLQWAREFEASPTKPPSQPVPVEPAS